MSTVSDREAKHMSIMHAIDQLIGTKNHLDNLFHEVGGPSDPIKEKTAEEAPAPTLSYVLGNAASQIINVSDDINGRINDLRELIL